MQQAEPQSGGAALKQALTRAETAEAYFAGLLNAAVDAIIVIDSQGLIETFSAAAERLFGYEAGEVLGHNVRLLMPEPYRSEHNRYISNYLETGIPKIIGTGRAVRGRRKDGRTFPMDLSVGEVRTEGLHRFVGIVRDASDQVRALHALRRQREECGLILGSVPALIWYVDRDGRVRYANAAVAELLGRPQAELARKKAAALLPKEQAIRFQADNEAILASGKPRYGTIEAFQTPTGVRWLQTDRIPRIGADGKPTGVIVASKDITDRLEAQEQSRLHQERLAHVTRLHSLGEMAAGIAHEMNQPLAAIANYAHACRRRIAAGTATPDKLMDLLGKIAEQAERTGEIIRSIRSMSKKEENRQQCANLGALVREALDMARTDSRSLDCPIGLDLPNSLPTVVVDPIQIQQVILNLIRNSLDAMESVPADERRIVVSASLHDPENVEVAVADWGIGLPDEAGERLFDPFFTTKHSGLGIGLSISRSIINSHGGQFWFAGNADRGTTFRFTLPIGNGE